MFRWDAREVLTFNMQRFGLLSWAGKCMKYFQSLEGGCGAAKLWRD